MRSYTVVYVSGVVITAIVVMLTLLLLALLGIWLDILPSDSSSGSTLLEAVFGGVWGISGQCAGMWLSHRRAMRVSLRRSRI